MTEQRISLKTAILAKEKKINFKLHTNAIYIQENECLLEDRYKCEDYLRPKSEPYISYKDHLKGMGSISTMGLAYTQSLLQKWLRETHGIHIYVQPMWIESENIVEFRAYIDVGPSSPVIPIHPKFNKYEDALEASLYKSLKLIK